MAEKYGPSLPEREPLLLIGYLGVVLDFSEIVTPSNGLGSCLSV